MTLRNKVILTVMLIANIITMFFNWFGFSGVNEIPGTIVLFYLTMYSVILNRRMVPLQNNKSKYLDTYIVNSLMNNHVHILLSGEHEALGRLVKRINTRIDMFP